MGGGGDTRVPETAQEKELAKIATEQWARYETDFKPLENQWLSQVTQDPANEAATTRGIVAGQVGAQFDQAQQENDAAMLSRGVNQNSGAFKVGMDRGNDTGMALTRANLGTTAKKTGELVQAIDMGRGQASEAQAGLTDVANQAASDAMKSSTNKWLKSNATGEMVGTGAGIITRSKLKE